MICKARAAHCLLVLACCLLACVPAVARHEVDGDLLSIGRAEGTWWYGGRTGGVRLILDRGSVNGEMSGYIITDVGQRLSERKGVLKGTIVGRRVRLVAEVEGATTEERTRWRLGGTIVPSQGIASGTIEGGGSWQVTFPPVEDAPGYGYMAFRLLLDEILAEPQASTLARHYFARRGQLRRYASWLLKEPDDPRRETRTQLADRLRALGEVNRAYLRLHREVWGGALRACHEGRQPAELEGAGLGRLLVGGTEWTDPKLWRVARREAPRLARRWRERHDVLIGLLPPRATQAGLAPKFAPHTQETGPPPRIPDTRVALWEWRDGVQGVGG